MVSPQSLPAVDPHARPPTCFVDVPRLFQALALFLAGAAFSWWVSRPAAVVTATREPASTQDSDRERAVVVDLTDHVDEPPIGIPPESATVPKSHPGAGQKRALARALDAFTKSPPPIDSEAPADEEAQAAVGAGLRAGFMAQQPEGDTP